MKSKNLLLIVSFFLICCSDAMAQETEQPSDSIVMLLNSKDLPSSDGQLLVIPGSGLFYADGNEVFALDESKSKLKKFRFRYGFPMDQIMCCEGKFFIKSQQYIISLDEDVPKVIAQFDTGDFSIFSGQDGHINVVIPEESGKWVWYQFHLATGELICVVRMDDPIQLVLDENGICACLSDNKVYVVTDDSLQLLVQMDEHVNDAVMTPRGMLISTDTVSYLLGDDMQPEPIPLGFHNLFYDNDTLYLVTNTGDIMKMSF